MNLLPTSPRLELYPGPNPGACISIAGVPLADCAKATLRLMALLRLTQPRKHSHKTGDSCTKKNSDEK